MDPLIIPIVALMIPIVIVPTALGIRHAKFLREVEHTERMRAMEMGRTLPGDESWTPGSIAVIIGGGVPIGAMGLAFMATKSTPFGGAIEAIWYAAGMIGLGGVICGSVLGFQLFARRDQPISADEKLAFDPEAYDVVGRRG